MCAHCTLMRTEGGLRLPRPSCSVVPLSAPPGVSKDRYASCFPGKTHGPVTVMLGKQRLRSASCKGPEESQTAGLIAVAAMQAAV